MQQGAETASGSFTYSTLLQCLLLSLTISIIKNKRFLLRVCFGFRARNANKPVALLAGSPSRRLMLSHALGLCLLQNRQRLILIQRSVVHTQGSKCRSVPHTSSRIESFFEKHLAVSLANLVPH